MENRENVLQCTPSCERTKYYLNYVLNLPYKAKCHWGRVSCSLPLATRSVVAPEIGAQHHLYKINVTIVVSQKFDKILFD